MSHLDDTRLLELGLADLRPTAEEAAHLQLCGDCAARLAEERALTDNIEALGLPEVPEGFAAATNSRFVGVRDARRTRRIGVALAAALAAAYFLALPLLIVALQGLGTVIKDAALLLAGLATWFDATLTLFLGAPTLSLLTLIMLAAVLLFWTGILARLGRQSAGEISGAVSS